MADIKEKKAMINDGQNIELDGVTVINEGISLAEAKKEEDTSVASEDVVIPSGSNEVSVSDIKASLPEVSPIDIPVAPVDLPIAPEVSPELPMTQETENAVPSFVQEVAPTYAYQSAPTTNTNFSTSGVYKSAGDVDMAEEAFLNEVKSAYARNIVEPTKTLVALVNDFKTWGNKVTSQGLNRSLFEEFDELSARYDGMEIAKYGDDTNSFGSPYENDSNNFGGMAA